jgi:cyclophilin family peptidyl-prolyl cis-trans isomerase
MDQNNPKKDKYSWIYFAALGGALVVTVVYFMMNGISREDSNISKAYVGGVSKISSATIETNVGNIVVEFFSDKAPKTVENFVKLAKSGFYNETKFHRVIRDFMIQGGDPLSKGDNENLYGRGGPGYTFKDEINDVKLVRGILAMANSGPNTNGSQFFIITAKETPWLQGKHTAFGKVVGGMNVVDLISKVETKDNDIPVKPIVIKSIRFD